MGHTYHSLGEIFDTYSNVLRVMELIKPKASSVESYKSEWGCSSNNTHKSKSPVILKKPTTLENFNIVSKQDKFRCRFCCDNAYSTNNNKIYASVKDRLDRCKVLGLGTLCTEPHHTKVNCRGKKGLFRPCWDCKSCCYAGTMCLGLDKSTLDTNTCY